MSVIGTKTEQHLLHAFAGESQARMRYEFYATVAKKEGYEQIAAILQDIANEEKSHASSFYKLLGGGAVEIKATFETGVFTTLDNLASAIQGEWHEADSLYPSYAKIAEEEGFKKIAVAFKSIASVEKEHHAILVRLWTNIKEGKVFEKDIPVKWKCRKCGYVHTGKKALETCPACLHGKKYFEVKQENY